MSKLNVFAEKIDNTDFAFLAMLGLIRASKKVHHKVHNSDILC